MPRANGGTNRISNLCLACEKCNLAKGTRDIKEFLKKKPEILKRILAQAKVPLKDAAAVNATRWALFEQLKATGLPVECGSGGLSHGEMSPTQSSATIAKKSLPPHVNIYRTARKAPVF